MSTDKFYIIKFHLYGGDADIDYDGFFTAKNNEWEEFKNKIPDDHPDFYIHVDCDNNLPVHFEDKKSFLSQFKVSEITELEYNVLKKLLKGHSGESRVYEWVYEL